MEIRRDLIERLVPEGEPPLLLLGPSVRATFPEKWSDLDRRSFLWASALIQAGFASGLPLDVGFSHVSAGFVAVSRDEANEFPFPSLSGVAFGLYVMTRPKGVRSVQTLRLANRSFPVVTVPGAIELHGPPNPATASSSCWLQQSTGTTTRKGILTCRHAVKGSALGASIPLTPSSSYSVPTTAVLADIDQSTIDAAVLEIDPADWPSGLSALAVHSPTAPGRSIEFEDRSGITTTGTVLRVFYYSTYVGNLMGQRVITDCHGRAGDSGSLLVDGSTTDGVGLYMGTIPDGVGGLDGIGQDLHQVTAFFGLSLFR